jgi:hypothetical protein
MGGDGSGLVIGDVRQVQTEDADESWERETSEPDVRGVGADRIDFAGGWNVTVAVMEFVREDPLESELRRRVAAALPSVDGVESAGEMDREVWFVTGTPSGEALVRAVAAAVDDLAGQTRAYAGG